MRFSMVFDNSGDTIPFAVKYNHELLNFFIEKVNQENQNSFSNNQRLYNEVSKGITRLHSALSATNQVLYPLTGKNFDQKTDLIDYLDQDFLNKIHCDWTQSQLYTINIDQLRHSTDHQTADLGTQLHEHYPDEIRNIQTAEAMIKLGHIDPYEDVNMAVHNLESRFTDMSEFSSDKKWQVFNNPYTKTMISNNDVVNFSFRYTYVGRQYYNKFKYFDTDLKYNDNYNYETLEFSFQLSLHRPQTIAFSPEATNWAKRHNVPLIAEQLPIANIPDLEEKLFKYRKILYRNSRDNNQAKIILE